VSLQVRRPEDVNAFLELAGPFLAAREAEHNLLFGICNAIRVTPELFADDPPRFFVVTDASERVVAASLRTPPHNQVLSEMDNPSAADALAEALTEEKLPGVLGPTQQVKRFAQRWTALTVRSARLAMAERIFRLDRVVPPRRPASGKWRTAEPQDRRVLADWLVTFLSEANPDEAPPPDALETADRWIAGRHRTVYLWEDEDRATSMVGAGGETPNGIRIGPVYTPPELRARGYATSLTAAATQDQLDRGRRFCFLFTDLANPTSNKIYEAIGYRAVCDVDMYRFGDP